MLPLHLTLLNRSSLRRSSLRRSSLNRSSLNRLRLNRLRLGRFNNLTLLLPIVVYLASSLSLSTSVWAAEASRPNFLVILCDDLGYGDLECFGHPVIETERINQFASEGVRLSSFYAPAPVCSPSRVGLLTGRIPNRLGVYDFILPYGSAKGHQGDNRCDVHLRRGEPTIASLLGDAGYATCLSGKWHCNSRFNHPSQPNPGDAGFDHWFATFNNASPTHKNPKNFVRNGEKVGPTEGFSCQVVADEAIGWLQDQQKNSPDQPFFLFVAYHEPHEPIASPEALVEKYLPQSKNREQAEYFANVHNVDNATGRLLDAVDELGLRENTLVVFTSDNGPETLMRYGKKARHSYGTPGPLRGMKLWTTEAGFRVPGIARWPGVIPQGVESSVPVSSLDFLPTFCMLAGVTPPADVVQDGVDCLEILKGKQTSREKPLLWAFYDALNERRVAMRAGEWKVLARLADENGEELPRMSNLYPGNYEQYAKAQLVDLQIFRIEDDLAEEVNLSTKHPVELKRLQKLLRESYDELLADSYLWEAKE